MCFHDDGGVTFEAGPNGERSVPVTLDERAGKAISALLSLESLEVAYSLGPHLSGWGVGRGAGGAG